MRPDTCIVIGYPQVQKLNINRKTPMGHCINLPDKVITGTQKMFVHCHRKRTKQSHLSEETSEVITSQQQGNINKENDRQSTVKSIKLLMSDLVSRYV